LASLAIDHVVPPYLWYWIGQPVSSVVTPLQLPMSGLGCDDTPSTIALRILATPGTIAAGVTASDEGGCAARAGTGPRERITSDVKIAIERARIRSTSDDASDPAVARKTKEDVQARL
jgi:hypothetical protein